jgi:hypothetical protein
MNFNRQNSNTLQNKCRKYNGFYPNFAPVLTSLSVTSSTAGIYSLVYVFGYNFLPNGNTYINFGSINNIPVTYYSSNNISFVVPVINNFGAQGYNVVAVNVYNGKYGFAVKKPAIGSLTYSNPLTYTIYSNINNNPSPPDFGYGPFIYPYPVSPTDPSNNASNSESQAFTYALTAYYNEELSNIYLNNQILVLQDIISQANNATKALFDIEIAKNKITETINRNLSPNLYENQFNSALNQYKTAIRNANIDILYAQKQSQFTTDSILIAQTNIGNATVAASQAYTYAFNSGNTAQALALTTQTDAIYLSVNTSGSIQTQIDTYLNNGFLTAIQTEINQYSTSSPAIQIINNYIHNLNILLEYLNLVKDWTNTVVQDASGAIIPLANG